MDILSDELSRARAQGAVFSVLHQVRPWGLRFGGRRPLTAHILLEGTGFIVRAGADPIPLQPRDVVLATAGTPYEIVSEVGAPTVPIGAAREKPLSAKDLDGPADALVMCGAYVLSGSVGESLLQSLPGIAIVAGRDQDPAHAAAIDLLAAEARATDSGQQALLDRLLDVNLVYALRAWWRSTDAAPGWYRALGNPPIRSVLEQLHADPALDWTLPAMSRAAGLSRAAFAAQFARVVGVPAGRYLTQLRMRRAEDALSRTDLTLAAIAGSVGYSNEFAFATAFRRHHGISPGRWRGNLKR
ncbi:AraC family transcriptional regulator [Kribbella sp. NPDC051587]|uniref:AraC family transcriptional regulator n=1 Tax=Kribbella sp. NPDC051587 TaxID=3364119 RepID=UPI0037A7E1A4